MPRAPRRRAPKVWRTASGQVMVRNSPAYLPPHELPTVLQLGMFNTAHDGDEALAFTPKATAPATPAVATPAAPVAPLATPAPVEPPAPAAAKKGGRKKKVQDAPQEWPETAPRGYAVKQWTPTTWQPVRLADPDQASGAYFPLLFDQSYANSATGQFCATEREAIIWLWKVALGKSIESFLGGARSAIYAAIESEGTAAAADPPGQPASSKQGARTRSKRGGRA